MTSTYYLGHTAGGQPVTRKSNRSDYTHAAVRQGYQATDNALPAFGTNAHGAAKNYQGKDAPEVVQVAVVDAAAFKAAKAAPAPAAEAPAAEAPQGDEFDAMDRDALCAALAEYEVDCDGMDDDAVRAELRTLAQTVADDDAAEQARADAEHADRQGRAQAAEQARLDEEARVEREHPMATGKPAPAPQAVVVSNESLPKSGRDGKCPHCGKPTRDGKKVTEFAEMSPGSQASTDHQFTCNECAGEWGPVVADKPKRNRGPKVHSTLGNPVKFMWDMLDAEPGLARKDAVARGIAAGVSPNTAATQFQWWRKARGLVAAK